MDETPQVNVPPGTSQQIISQILEGLPQILQSFGIGGQSQQFAPPIQQQPVISTEMLLLLGIGIYLIAKK
jgi:hypothetical protein